jgi:hypothetical protein
MVSSRHCLRKIALGAAFAGFVISVLALIPVVTRIQSLRREQKVIQKMIDGEVNGTVTTVQWAPNWLNKCIPDDYDGYLSRAEELQLFASDEQPADLGFLAALPNLETVVLSNWTVTNRNVEQITSLPRLRRVYLVQPTLCEDQLQTIRNRRPDLLLRVDDPWRQANCAD